VWKDCGKSPTSLLLERLQNLLAGLRAVYGPSSHGSTPLYAAYGQMLSKNQAGILNRWAEHFNSALNHVSNHEGTDQLPQRSIHEELEDVPTEAETIKALKKSQYASVRLVLYMAGCNTASGLTMVYG